MSQRLILPPQCIGILGGGQLGMMLAAVARQSGYQVAVLDPDPQCPARKVADYHLQTAYDDAAGLSELARLSAVITTEFENVPAAAIQFLSLTTPVYPAAAALLIAQNRIKEKTLFRSLGLQTTPFSAINSLAACNLIPDAMFPAILKTTTLGYDGKGQRRVHNCQQLALAYAELGQAECILEKMVELSQEVSLIIARNAHGSQIFPLIENHHRNGILEISYIPAALTPDLAAQAMDAALKIGASLNYIGILTIEFFITAQQELLINEIAPRPHNSGHITIESCMTSQFEQQLRAICGLPLGSTQLKEPGAMFNLLGELWLEKSPNPYAIILQHNPQAKLHSYGKIEAKPGRKMGHLSLTGSDQAALAAQITSLKQQLNLKIE